MTAYHRVLLKLSGEVFGGGRVGVDPHVVDGIAAEIADVVRSGVQVAIVVGGGNFFRGVELLRVKGAAKAAARGAERETAAGLDATSGNALVEL